MTRIRSEEHARRLRYRLLWKLGGWILFVVIVLGGLIGLSHWKGVQIGNFRIRSGGAIATSTVKQVVAEEMNENWLGILSRNNILLLPRRQIKTSVRNLSPRIRDAAINLTGLRSFTLRVQTREPAVQLCPRESTSTTCRSADITGFVYAALPKNSISTSTLTLTGSKLPKIGSRIIPKTTFQTFMAFVRQLPELGFIPINGRFGKARDIILRTYKRGANTIATTTTVNIKINLQDDLQRKFSSLKTVVERNSFVASTTTKSKEKPPTVSPFALEYIDLRFENKVFYK